jgi:hypothetical protein
MAGVSTMHKAAHNAAVFEASAPSAGFDNDAGDASRNFA